MAQFDLALPKFGAGDLDDEKQRRKIMNYLVKLDEQLRFVLNNLDTENFTETFQQVIVSGGGGGSGESSESLKALEEEINRLSTKVTQTANEIALKASAEELNELGDLMRSLNAEFKVLAGEISTKVSKEEYDALGNTVSQHSTAITQTAEKIESTAKAVETLDGKVEEQSTRITQTAEKIESKAEKSVVNALGQTVSEHSTAITQTANKIESTAKAVETLDETVSKHESAITQTPKEIQMAVESVQIGGRNYILGTGTPYTAVGNGSRQWLYPWHCASIAANSSLYGKTVTISFDYEEAITSGSFSILVGGLWIGVKSFSSDTGSGHFTLTREHADFEADDDVFIYIDGIWTGSVTFSNVKVEIGNKATDWSPAPEDADAAIAELSAAITIQAGEITSNAKKIETVSEAAGNAQSSANAAQNTANAAQNAANSAQGTANGAVTRVTEAEKKISAVEGEITSKVSKKEFDELGRLVSEQETKIEQTDEQVLILAGRRAGGTQLLKNGGFYGGLSNWSKLEYNVNGEYREMYYEPVSPNDYRANEVPNLVLLAQYETGMFGAAQVVKGLRKNTQYTISGYAASHRSNRVGIEIRDTTASRWAMNPVFDVGWGGTNLSAYNRFEYTFDTGDYSDYQIMLYSNNFQDNAYVWWAQVKLEEGNTATAWSPHPDDPASGVDAGGVVRVDQTGVHMSGGTIDMETADGDEYIHIRNDGISASSLSAPNVAKRYSGPGTLYVNPNATSEQIAAGNYFRSLEDAFGKLNGHYLNGEVAISCASGAALYGAAELVDAVGGKLIVTGNGATLYGSLAFKRNSCSVQINGLNVSTSNGNAMTATNCGYIEMWSNTLNSSAGAAIVMTGGGQFYATSCTLIGGGGMAANITTATLAVFIDCIGTGKIVVQYAALTAGGTVPLGGVENWGASLFNASGVTPTGPDGTPAVPVISTATYNYTNSDSYRGGWSYFDTDAPRQGFNGMDIYGTIWFDAAAIRSALSGKTIKQASLRLFMVKGVGRGRSVVVQLHGTNMGYDGRSGRPKLTTSYGTIGTTEPDMNNEMTIPTAVIDDIVSGRIQALVLKSDDTVEYKDKFYSENYARFEGGTDKTTADNCPRLTVVYQ